MVQKKRWGAGGVWEDEAHLMHVIGQLIYQLGKKHNKIMKGIVKLSNFFWTLFPECEKSVSMKSC